MVDNREKDIIILGDGLIHGLDDTTIIISIILISVAKKVKLFESPLQCSQQLFHANGEKIHQFKTRDSKIKPF